MVGLVSWQRCFGDSLKHLAALVASTLKTEVKLTAGEDGGERRGCASDVNSIEFTDTLAGSITFD